MRRNFFSVLLSILLAACNAAPVIPATQLHTPTVAPASTPASTSIPDRYQQNIHLFDYDADTSSSITEASVRQQDGYTLHEISYPSPKDGDVPAYLLLPDGEGPFAAILLMHGSSGSRLDMLPFAKDLVATGAVVLTISAPSARPQPGSREWLTFSPQDREDQIQLMVDLRRAVDLLSQQEKVDPARIGYVGYSYGAAMGGLLAGIEPRIKAYGLMVGDGGLVNHFTDGDKPVGGFETIAPSARKSWLEAMDPIEPIYFVGHAAPSALFFQNAYNDRSVTEADALAYQAAGSEPKKVQWYDSGHGLPPAAYIDMVNWLAGQIGINATKFRQSP